MRPPSLFIRACLYALCVVPPAYYIVKLARVQHSQTANAYTQGYDAAVDSMAHAPVAGAMATIRALDAFGVGYTVLIHRGDSTVAIVHTGATWGDSASAARIPFYADSTKLR